MDLITELTFGCLSTALCLSASLLSTQYDTLSEYGQGLGDNTMVAVPGGGGSSRGAGRTEFVDDSRFYGSGRICRVLQGRIMTGLTPYANATRITQYAADPNPLVVLFVWLIAASTLLILRESCSRKRRCDVTFGSGVLLAGILGATEGATIRSIILTNAPWCLTGMTVVEICLRIAQGRSTHDVLHMAEEKKIRP